MRSLQLNTLVSLCCLTAAPVLGAFQIPNAPKPSYTRAASSATISKLISKLYVSNYNGNVTTFHLGTTSGTALAFTPVSKNTDCGKQPTWLNYDRTDKVLYCLNEQWDPSAGSASLAKYTVDDKGTLELSKVVNTTFGGPVHTVWVPTDGGKKGLHVIAHYEPGGLSAFDQDLNYVSSENLTTFNTPPPDALVNQKGAHAHETILDPTGKYVFTPDLGQDRVWVVNYGNVKAGENVSYEFFPVPPKTGPRHAVFVPMSGKSYDGKTQDESVYFYVVGEISSNIEGYQVNYKEGAPSWVTHLSSTNANNAPWKQGYAAGELALSPDRNFLIVSNRNTSLSSIDNCDEQLKNCKSEPVDTLVTFKPTANGTLEHVQTWSAGGMLPRSFSLNSKGDMIAVGTNSRVVIMQRDVKTGMIGQVIADAVFDTPDQVTNIVWDEEEPDKGAPFFRGQFNVY